jgi:hypothetical protein
VVRGSLVAAGFSSSKLIVDAVTQVEDVDASRRVEFRVRTEAEERLSQIVERSQGGMEHLVRHRDCWAGVWSEMKLSVAA